MKKAMMDGNLATTAVDTNYKDSNLGSGSDNDSTVCGTNNSY